ncbi:MAG: hypothetical protein ACRCZK_03650 [Oscillospiraceae bacterium]
MFVLDYLSTKYETDISKPSDVSHRKKALEKASVQFKEPLDSSITISKVTNMAIKRKKVVREVKDFTMYEYIVKIEFAYRTVEADTTTQIDFSEKVNLVRDAVFGGYTITMETPHDFTIATGMSEGVKKAFETYEKKENTLTGESMEESEKGVYKDALKVFFKTYGTSLANAQSLVSDKVYLPELTGKFDTEAVVLLEAKKTASKVSVRVQVPYKIEGILVYKKKYHIVFENKTINKLEEI